MTNCRPPYFPMMIDIYGKDVLIVGGGNIASRRADTLLRCGAKVIIIAPEIRCEGSVLVLREFQPEDITENLSLVIAATNRRDINRLVHDTAKAKGIPVNVCDCQSECDFFFPSLINHENIAVSVCSAGMSSSLTHRLSNKLREVWAVWVSEEMKSETAAKKLNP